MTKKKKKLKTYVVSRISNKKRLLKETFLLNFYKNQIIDFGENSLKMTLLAGVRFSTGLVNSFLIFIFLIILQGII